MPLTPAQHLIATSEARFVVGVTGRRFGKTTVGRRRICMKAAQPNKQVAYIAPTYKQAKRIAWKKFKNKLRSINWLDGKPNESELIINLRSGSSIQLFGAENYDAIRGLEFDHVMFDEFDDCPIEAWDEVIRACLSNKLGTADFFGSPEGRGNLYQFYKRGQSEDPMWQNWQSFQFTTVDGGQVPDEEIEAAKRELDELTFQQEYLASFINFTGRAYHAFDERNQARLSYDPTDDLVLCFDFNTSPGTATIIQEQLLPTGDFGTGVIGEVYIPKSSNTPRVCETLLDKIGNHKGDVIAFGDASGGNKTSQGVNGSDWDIIDSYMSRAFGDRFFKRVPSANPRERARVNAVNSRCKSLSNEIRLMVDPSECPYTIEDFEGTKILEGSNGRLDKSKKGANAKFTHITDGIGYYVHKCFDDANHLHEHHFL